jgi:hypothetical protein
MMMSVKFKLGFTIDAETLFGIISKFLPVENLSVEELAPAPLEQFSSQLAKELGWQPRPVRLPQVRKKKGSGYAMNLHAGANAIMMAMFSDGKVHLPSDCFPSLKAAGFSVNGSYGKFERLKRHGIVVKLGKGKWQITPKGKELWEKRLSPQENAA